MSLSRVERLKREAEELESVTSEFRKMCKAVGFTQEQFDSFARRNRVPDSLVEGVPQEVKHRIVENVLCWVFQYAYARLTDDRVSHHLTDSAQERLITSVFGSKVHDVLNRMHGE